MRHAAQLPRFHVLAVTARTPPRAFDRRGPRSTDAPAATPESVPPAPDAATPRRSRGLSQRLAPFTRRPVSRTRRDVFRLNGIDGRVREGGDLPQHPLDQYVRIVDTFLSHAIAPAGRYGDKSAASSNIGHPSPSESPITLCLRRHSGSFSVSTGWAHSPSQGMSSASACSAV